MNRKKITIVGAGNIGATLALLLARRETADITLVDIDEGIAKGKALDIMEASPILGFNAHVTGTADYADTANSDVVVITAGFPRKPGMSRDDLLFKNFEIVKSVSEQIKKYSPDAFVIVVTNPLDAMTYTALKVTGFPKERVMGMAGVLDSARFAYFISEKTGISVENIKAFVIGGHGDDMVPLRKYTTISGMPVTNFLSDEELSEIIERTRFGGGEIVQLLKTGSAFYAPAASILEMVIAILWNKRKILSASVYLDGEIGEYYGASGLCVGVPIVLGKEGVEEIIKLDLSDEEWQQWRKSVESVRKLVEKLPL
ncbi:malate dehydrogenase [Phorcysia thermohydrogeniphila]|uniref:Malate dehydrogenase n=1 Tax=Phorcysia thermohydrogeniphila TaxID=936138 RepID=A0A4V2PDU8_9BACT|nr:malate dehydrogenase [Phorcysia thermohydrogeniphila]TCK06506.1 malate dehydrogenase (NAD) [Phorcysia thermohydrogeniphila]